MDSNHRVGYLIYSQAPSSRLSHTPRYGNRPPSDLGVGDPGSRSYGPLLGPGDVAFKDVCRVVGEGFEPPQALGVNQPLSLAELTNRYQVLLGKPDVLVLVVLGRVQPEPALGRSGVAHIRNRD